MGLVRKRDSASFAVNVDGDDGVDCRGEGGGGDCPATLMVVVVGGRSRNPYLNSQFCLYADPIHRIFSPNVIHNRLQYRFRQQVLLVNTVS